MTVKITLEENPEHRTFGWGYRVDVAGTGNDIAKLLDEVKQEVLAWCARQKRALDYK